MTAFALMLAAAPAVAEPFVLLIYGTPDQIALCDDLGECPRRPGRTAGQAHAPQQAIGLTEDAALRDRLLRRMPAA